MKEYHTYNAIEIAFSLIDEAKKIDKSFTNLQLQKLVYVSHGLSLAQLNRPLIMENVYAWKYGPVIPSIYFEFNNFGSNPVDRSQKVILDKKSLEIIQDVVKVLGSLSGNQLVSLTHIEGSPWSKMWDGSRAKSIPDSLIKEHYVHVLQTGHISCL